MVNVHEVRRIKRISVWDCNCLIIRGIRIPEEKAPDLRNDHPTGGICQVERSSIVVVDVIQCDDLGQYKRRITPSITLEQLPV